LELESIPGPGLSSAPTEGFSETNNLYYSVRLYPESVLVKSLSEALAKSDVVVPAYAELILDVASRRLTAQSGWGRQPAQIQSRPLLAEASGTLTDLPFFARNYPLRVQVVLASPDLLYAHQRQRTLMFGGLILLSTLAAIVGLAAAYRAFRRQLRLSDMKSNFVSSVSHELRAPIASVRLMAESLERGRIADTSKQQEYYRFISRECRRHSSLIENVLDFSRVDQGRKQYEFEPTDLVALTQQTVKLMEPYAAEKQVHLSLSLDSTRLAALGPHPPLDGKAIPFNRL
jgi:signal transduction histidine kinase